MKYSFLQTTLFALIVSLAFNFATIQAQDKIVIDEIDGIEVSYQIQFLRTDEKKNASKSKDEYQIIGYLTNNSGQDLYSQTITPIRVEVSNATGLTKAAKPAPRSTPYMTIENRTLYAFKAGTTIQDQAKIKVPKGIKPIVNYNKNGLLKAMSQWKLKINEAVIDGRWQFEGSSQVVNLRFDNVQNTIIQGNAINAVTWYTTGNDIYERAFVGVGVINNPTPTDPAATYRATLTLVEPGRLLYTNTEGVSCYLIKL